MKIVIKFLLFCVLTVFHSPAVLAKGVTVMIEVSGPGQDAPLDITDPEVVGRFSIWTGPNSRWRGEDGVWHTDYSGAYVDFAAGQVQSLPSGLLHFDVEFFIAGVPGQQPVEETYTARFAFEPGSAGGYVYLKKGQPFVYHGLEGNWFRSTQPWEERVRPLIRTE